MLLDVHLAGISGIEVLKITKENYSYVEVIVISATKELDAAIEAMPCGAYHYLSKDSDMAATSGPMRRTSRSLKLYSRE